MKPLKNTYRILITGSVLFAWFAATCAVHADLTHRYSFDDVTTSTNAIDSVGGATGDVYPGAYYLGDGTISLDGSSGFVYLPDDIVSNYASITFEIWTTPYSNPTWARLFDFGTNEGGKGTGGSGGTGGNGVSWLYLCLSDGNGLYRGDLNPPGLNITGPQPAAAVAHHLVFTIDATAQTAALYDNGVMVAFNPNFAGTPIDLGHTYNDYIGRSQWPDPYYSGTIDEFRIYDSALNPAQVEADFEAGANSITADPGALSSIQLDIPTGYVPGAIQAPRVIGNYASLTRDVDITTLPGITYSSSDTNVVAFGADGNFHAVAPGTATLQASYQSLNSTVSVTVAPEPVVLEHRYSFNGAAGTTTITDSQGSANGTLIYGSDTSTLGGGQLKLDGNFSSAYVELPAGIISELTNATFQAWVTWDGGNQWQRIFDFGTNSTPGNDVVSTYLSPSASGNILRWGFNFAGEQDVDAPSQLVRSNEVCVTVSYSYSLQTASLYVDGRKVGSGTVNKALYNVPDGNNWLGRSQFLDPFYSGAFDEFRIYSGAASGLQVAIAAAAGPDDIVTDPGALQSIRVVVSPTNVDVHGLSVPVQVLADFANISSVDVSTLSDTVISSSNPQVGQIQDGNLLPIGPGSISISASYSNLVASTTVNVMDTDKWPSVLHRYSFSDSPGTTTTPSSATTVQDSVGSADGTYYGVGTFTGSELALPAGNFRPNSDGTHNTNETGYVLLPAGTISSLPSKASFEFWINWRGGDVWQEFMSFGQGGTPGRQTGGGQYIMLCPAEGVGGPDRKLRAEWWSPSQNFALTGPQLPTDVPLHIVLTHDEDRQIDKLYLDGEVVASGSFASAAAIASFASLNDTDNYLGADQWPDPNFNGSYDEFRIWDGALTPAQVAADYAGGPDRIVGPTLMIAPSGAGVAMSWPTNATGFSLQTSPSLSPADWSGTGLTPMVVDGMNTVTVSGPLSGTAYYRLSQ